MATSNRGVKKTRFLLRLVVSAVILGLILSRVDTTQVAQLLPSVSPLLLFLGFMLLILDRMTMSYRWYILVKAKGITIPFSNIVRIYFVSAFLGLFMPSSVAPDFIRVYMATKHRCPMSDALSSVFLDRFIAFLTLSALSFVSSVLAFSFSDLITVSPWIVVATLGPLLASSAIMVAIKHDYSSFKPFFSHRIAIKAINVISDFRNSITSYKDDISSIKKVSLVCLVNHIIYILTTYVVALAMNIHIPFLYLCITVPLVSFLTMVPISLAGLGIQEGAYIYFLSQMGISSQGAFAIAVMIRIIITLGCLPGGILYLLGSDPVDEAGQPEDDPGPASAPSSDHVGNHGGDRTA
jgi:glycosyltransferase 2 family protein